MKKLSLFLHQRNFYSTKNSFQYFNKLLIANRGEIACRIIKTCQKLGIPTVAVFSDADTNSKFVKLADESFYIGSNKVEESYNNIETIINAMKETGCDCVHPGYGFLSENSEFANRVESEGFTFIGPPSTAIVQMGDKLVSKQIAIDAGVHVIPGSDDCVDTSIEAVEIANNLGYPVMLKASAGGGGKGMRVCHDDEEVLEGFDLCKAEARSFANDKMLVEKFIDNPRHVEMQVLGDKHGNYVYLNERECSIQRRHQKVIEEAPCPIMDEKTRAKMGAQAVALAKKVGYFSAGTVEMMVSQNENDEIFFYFLEMNTRLQVEHPVTEYITGLDLVEEMIKIAAGEELSMSQSDVKINGWSTECRVYAENPYNNFAPAIGHITRYLEPEDENESIFGGNVRVDSGIMEKDTISVFFDPLICKLISYGKDRNESINNMVSALDNYVIYGEKMRTNVPFLRDVLGKEKYLSGDLTTNFIEEEYPNGFTGVHLTIEDEVHLAIVAAMVEFKRQKKNSSVSGGLKSTGIKEKMNLAVYMEMVGNEDEEDEERFKERCVDYDDDRFCCKIVDVGDNKFNVTVNDRVYELESDWTSARNPLLFFKVNGERKVMQIYNHDIFSMLMQYKGQRFKMDVHTAREALLKVHMPQKVPLDTDQFLVAEMAGQIVDVLVKEGDIVKEGDDMLVMEAMKMQNRLKAPGRGKVKKVFVEEGDIVENDKVMIEFE